MMAYRPIYAAPASMRSDIDVRVIKTSAIYTDKQISDNTTWKLPAKVATTTDVVLEGTQTIDGIDIKEGDRVLVKDQVDKVQNGLYLCYDGEWKRTYDMRIGNFSSGNTILVSEGTENSEKMFICTNNHSESVVGTDELDFTPYGGGSGGGGGDDAVPGGTEGSVQINQGGDFNGSSWVISGDTMTGGDLVCDTISGKLLLPEGNIVVGSSSGLGESVAVTGDVTLSTSGALTLNDVAASGSYTNANITIDSKGRVTSATDGTLPSPVTPGGTEGSIQINQGGDFNGSLWTINGDTLTGPNLTVNDSILGKLNLPEGNILVGSSGGLSEPVAVSGDVTLSTSGVVTLNDIVADGSYTNANITIDSKGRITSASNGTLPSPVTPGGTEGSIQINQGGEFNGSPWTISGGTMTGTDLVCTTISGKLLIPEGNIVVGSSSGLGESVAVTGDVTLSTSGALTLSDVATSGSYTNANITIDSKGRVTSATDGTLPSPVTPGGTEGSIQINQGGGFNGSLWTISGDTLTGDTLNVTKGIDTSKGITTIPDLLEPLNEITVTDRQGRIIITDPSDLATDTFVTIRVTVNGGNMNEDSMVFVGIQKFDGGSFVAPIVLVSEVESQPGGDGSFDIKLHNISSSALPSSEMAISYMIM